MIQRLPQDSEPAHLANPADVSYAIRWFNAPEWAGDVIDRFWVPVWSVPVEQVSRQQVLMYPGCVAVVYATSAEFRGVATGLSTVELVGDGWAVGVKLRPAAAFLATGRPVVEFTDRVVDLTEALTLPPEEVHKVTSHIREAMRLDPSCEMSQTAAAAAMASLFAHLTVDDEACMANRIVDAVQDENVETVAALSELVGLSPRSLQRVCKKRLGLTPLWLIRRKRLQDAAGKLRELKVSLADLAADLGYSDHAHFTRDFTTVTGMAPREYAARW